MDGDILRVFGVLLVEVRRQFVLLLEKLLFYRRLFETNIVDGGFDLLANVSQQAEDKQLCYVAYVVPG